MCLALRTPKERVSRVRNQRSERAGMCLRERRLVYRSQSVEKITQSALADCCHRFWLTGNRDINGPNVTSTILSKHWTVAIAVINNVFFSVPPCSFSYYYCLFHLPIYRLKPKSAKPVFSRKETDQLSKAGITDPLRLHCFGMFLWLLPLQS